MVLKTLKLSSEKGITFVEVIVVVGIITVIFSVIALIVNPAELQSRARDEKRLGDISALERAISEYLVTNGSYPDTADLTRTSAGGGNWITVNLSQYIENIPSDPTNSGSYVYSYRHNVSGFELNAVLEYYTEKMAEDGGNNSAVFEVGNNLTIL